MSRRSGGNGLLACPQHRKQALAEVRARLLAADAVVLTTHVNADGDGTGSQAAVAAWLTEHGVGTTIVNPTPFPDTYRFLVPENTPVSDWGGADARAALEDADALLVLDTSEASRIAPLASHFPRERTLVLDHHPPGREAVSDFGLLDASAAATGELVYDLLLLEDGALAAPAALGIYVALVTDTGSFRYSNTTPRAHVLAADLIAGGVDPEAVYRLLFATVPHRRVELLREALATLEHASDTGVSWLVVSNELISRVQARPDDLDGLVEYARSLEGTEIALLFRETSDGHTKVSLRSNGAADVNRIAREFGGGGHIKASGATLPGRPAHVVPQVLELAAREIKRAAGAGAR